MPPPYVVGQRVQGMGRGPKYTGKWFKGTITSVKLNPKRNLYNYRIEFDRTKGKTYPIAQNLLRPYDAEKGPVPDGLPLTSFNVNAVEFKPKPPMAPKPATQMPPGLNVQAKVFKSGAGGQFYDRLDEKRPSPREGIASMLAIDLGDRGQ